MIRIVSWRVFLAIVVALLLLATLVPYRNDLGWIDPVTGSARFQTRRFLVPTSTIVHRSAIEDWIVRREGRYEANWKPIFDTSSKLLGRCRACGMPPESYEVGLFDKTFVRDSSDAEISKFVQIMRHGTKSERRNAVDALGEKVLKTRGPIAGTRPKG